MTTMPAARVLPQTAQRRRLAPQRSRAIAQTSSIVCINSAGDYLESSSSSTLFPIQKTCKDGIVQRQESIGKRSFSELRSGEGCAQDIRQTQSRLHIMCSASWVC